MIAVLLAIAFATDVATVVNNKQAIDRLERQVEHLRQKLPH
ncbi:hypothetical protein AB0C02_26125 [Micromonospora sp. NPDC048999]